MNIWSLPVRGSDSFSGVDSVDSKASLSFELWSVQLFIEPAVGFDIIFKYPVVIFHKGDYPSVNLSPTFSFEVSYFYF